MASNMLSIMGPISELMRINRPVGILNIFFPYMYGFFFIRLIDDTSYSVQSTLGVQFPILFFSAFVLRSVGCVWNDIVDMDIDKLVARTRTRPLPRGAIGPFAAYWVAFALFAIWTGTVALLLPDPVRLAAYAIPLTALVIGYPYMKRVTNYAQVFLGFTLAWGVLFGAAIAGFDVLDYFTQAFGTAQETHNFDKLASDLFDPRVCGLMALHFVYVVWSVIHDTIYAFQDYKDDKKAGVMSMALTLSGKTKPVLWTLSHIQVLLLIAASIYSVPDARSVPDAQSLLSSGASGSFPTLTSMLIEALQSRRIFLVVAVLGNALVLSLMVGRVNLSDPLDCARWFKTGSVWVGSTIGLGFLLEYVWQVL
jgi:4-hydroxybenzoate polyprenyltransferase